MQEHAEDIHSRPLERCGECSEPLKAGETICRNCGAKATQTGPVPQTTEEPEPR